MLFPNSFLCIPIGYLCWHFEHRLCRLSESSFAVLLPEHGVDVGELLGAVELLCCLSRDGLEGQHPGPQVRVVIVEVAQFRPLGVGAEPTTAPVSEGVDSSICCLLESILTQVCSFRNVIKLVDAVQ